MEDGKLLGFFSIRGMQHYIRLRKFVPINDQLSAELGVDLNVKRQNYFPHAALTYQVCSDTYCCFCNTRPRLAAGVHNAANADTLAAKSILFKAIFHAL